LSIREVFNILFEKQEPTSITEWFCETKVEKISFILTVIFLLLTFSMSTSKNNLSGYFLLASFLCSIIYSTSSFYSSYKFFINPLEYYLKNVFIALDDEDEIHNKLNIIDEKHLEKTIDRLSFELERIDKRLGTLIGAIDKLGIFPAIIGFYVTASKLFSDTQPGIMFYLMVGLAAGIYFSSLPVIGLINRLEKGKFIIECNLAAREKSDIETTI